MQFLVAALLGGLATVMASLVGRVLLALGVSYLTFTGVSSLGDWISQQVQTSMAGLPSDISAFLGFLWVDKAVTMIFSAWVAALTFKLGGSDTLTAMIIRKST